MGSYILNCLKDGLGKQTPVCNSVYYIMPATPDTYHLDMFPEPDLQTENFPEHKTFGEEIDCSGTWTGAEHQGDAEGHSEGDLVGRSSSSAGGGRNSSGGSSSQLLGVTDTDRD